MLIPPKPIVLAIWRWLELLPIGGVDRARGILTAAREYEDLTPTQYAEALEWITRMGLDQSGAQRYFPDDVLESLILACRPSWFEDADVLVHEVLELPEDLVSAAETLGVDGRSTLAAVRRVWGKVDAQLRAEVGAAGELEVLRRLDVRAGVVVTHVAERSDAFGFDISIRHSNGSCNLEVKSTTRRERRLFYLSRNEFETMLGDPEWYLVFVVLDEQLRMRKFLSVPREWIAENAPVDQGIGSRWEAVRFDPPSSVFRSGLPVLAELLSSTDSPLLSGVDMP